MAEQDSLDGFDFSKMSKPGKFLKFEAGKPVTIRILTKDPVIQEKEFQNADGPSVSTKLCFIVWNFTDEVAQIMAATPKMAETFQRIGKDEDFGSNLQKCDIKISPEGEKLNRVYEVNVVRHSGNEKDITAAMVAKAKEIDLDNDVQDNRGRLSIWAPKPKAPKPTDDGGEDETPGLEFPPGDEPINLDDIPF